MLPISATGDDYANLIIEKLSDSNIYEKLVRSSRQEYDNRLNWHKWAERFYQLFLSLKY